ncbi:F-box/LRR-repeat protein 12 isoform X1 [Canna indica]|uniref:F-box/LRR-repeat protein 12 isoform X1 n=1 Tax=Canna indica TaxID=4628 RepID=A0AAQ3K528_9LILI|nr:F-box/LRR-repeat protein 12 isoform X1 [Canna indica]
MESQFEITGALLPDDCLQIIFQNLQTRGERNAFGLTCRQWLQIQNLARRSLALQLSYDPKVYRNYAIYLPRLLTRFPCLHSLSLAGCTELPDSALTELRHFGSNIRSLSLYCCFSISGHGFAHVSVGCPHLVSITLYRCCITDAGLRTLAEHCRVLENVDLSHCIQISDQGINALLGGCTKLRRLIISYCMDIRGTGFAGCSPTLTYLAADSCILSPEGLFLVVRGGGLEYLNVSSLRAYIDPDVLSVIGAGSASKLRFLNLRMCRFLSDHSVACIAQGCPLLEEWNLAVCHDVHNEGWFKIGSTCRNLRILHVNRCRNLNNLGLQALVDCVRLTVLYMHGCQQVTYMGLEAFRMLRQDVEIRTEECVSIGSTVDNFFAN